MHCAQLTLQDGRSQLGRGRASCQLKFLPGSWNTSRGFSEIRTDLIREKEALRRGSHFHFEKHLTLLSRHATCTPLLPQQPSLWSSLHHARAVLVSQPPLPLFYLSFSPLLYCASSVRLPTSLERYSTTIFSADAAPRLRIFSHIFKRATSYCLETIDIVRLFLFAESIKKFLLRY